MTDIDQWLASAPKKDETPEERTMTRGKLLASIFAQQQQMMLQQAEMITALEQISDLLLVQLSNEQVNQAKNLLDLRRERDTLARLESEMEN